MGKWIKCKNCGHEYHNDLKECPQCYHKTPLTLKRLILPLLSLFLVAAFTFGVIWMILDDANFKTAQHENSSSNESVFNSEEKIGPNNSSSNSSSENADSTAIEESSDDTSSSSVTSENRDDNKQNISENVEYINFSLPEKLDTEKVIKSLDSRYFPLRWSTLDSAFNASDYFKNYCRTLEQNNTYLRIGGKLPCCVIYQYEIRGYVKDIDNAKQQCREYISDNMEYFKLQFETIKKYAKEVESFQVRFDFLYHNEDVVSNEIK